MKRSTGAIVCLTALAGASGIGGCGLQKNPPATVLRTEDFIADPTTTPTDRAGSNSAAVRETEAAAPQETTGSAEPVRSTLRTPGEAPVATISPPEGSSDGSPLQLGASDEPEDLVAFPGEPLLAADGGEPATDPVLVDAKVGEINGRPIRVEEVFNQIGGRLRTAALNRTLTKEDWALLKRPASDKTISRTEWVAFARALFQHELDQLLEDELFQAEARATLKPEEQAGLRAWVNELAQQERRRYGGSQAELARRLQRENMTEHDLRRMREAAILVGHQLNEQIRSRVRVSWKDVRLFYERNYEIFNPPPTASFRLIQVPLDQTERIAQVQEALDSGTNFIEVARTPANSFARDSAGYVGEKNFQGEYARATFFDEPLNKEAQGLSPGAWAGPVDFKGYKTWIYLDELKQLNMPLSNRDVQLMIANHLTKEGEKVERTRYIQRLKARASSGDLEAMAEQLTQLAVQRYWPHE